MGLIEMASGNSVWCGMDYYERKMVCSWKKSGEETYDGVVSGSEGNKYSVHIDKMHPRKSSCNCPFAEGRRIICKHMIALLFTAEPETNCQGLFNQIHRKLTKGARSTVWLLTPHLTDYIFPFSRSLQRYA